MYINKLFVAIITISLSLAVSADGLNKECRQACVKGENLLFKAYKMIASDRNQESNLERYDVNLSKIQEYCPIELYNYYTKKRDLYQVREKAITDERFRYLLNDAEFTKWITSEAFINYIVDIKNIREIYDNMPAEFKRGTYTKE